MDSQSVKIAPESAHISGFDGHKRVKGREAPSISRYARHPAVLLCDTCQYARYEKRARRLLARLKYFVPRLTTIWADSAYRGKD
jgi:putative transposase